MSSGKKNKNKASVATKNKNLGKTLKVQQEENKNSNVAVKEPVNVKAEVASNGVSKTQNRLLWSICFSLLILVIGGNFYYANHVVTDEGTLGRLARVGIVILGILLALVSALFTTKGKALLKFSQESYIELRKVTWPTRTQAVQTTAIIFVAVAVVSLFLYLCDVIFLQIIKYITL